VLRRAVLAVGRALGWALVGMLLVGAVLFIRFLRSGPELEPWHRARLDEEFTVARADEVRTIADYRALEGRLFAELDREVYAETEPEDRLPFNRYFRGSQSDPATWPHNWNSTWEHAPAAPPAIPAARPGSAGREAWAPSRAKVYRPARWRMTRTRNACKMPATNRGGAA